MSPNRNLCSLFSIFVSSSEPSSDDRGSTKDRTSSYANDESDSRTDDDATYNFWH